MNNYLIKFTMYYSDDNGFVLSDNCILQSRKLHENFIYSIKDYVRIKYVDDGCYDDYNIVIDNIIKLDY